MGECGGVAQLILNLVNMCTEFFQSWICNVLRLCWLPRGF